MNISRLVAELTISEDLRLKPYRCTSGKLSIGIGRNLDDVGISADEAVILCINDIDDRYQTFMRFPWFRALDEVRQEAIIRMAFNLGTPRLLKFKKMIHAMWIQDWERASLEALNSRWAVQVGHRAYKIAELIRTGKYNHTYPPNPTSRSFIENIDYRTERDRRELP
jgi:lysozyme